jgi:DNA-nicking Smr family endonuclease
MSKKNKPELSDDDKAAFRAAMRGVKPLSPAKKVAPIAPIPKKRLRSPKDDEVTFPFSDYEKLTPVGSEDLLEFSRPGIQHKMLRKLRLGQYNVDAILDLHGQTVEEARDSLSEFILTCRKKALRHVLIIHGKGRGGNKPVLKNKLNHWLRETEYVLAFCSATREAGRGGALYVLLKG